MSSRAVKLFAILFACLGLAFGLAACGGDDDSSGTVALTELPGPPQAGDSPGGATAGKTPTQPKTEPAPVEEEPAEEPAAEEESGGAGGANAEGKAIFAQSCAGCHTLADAGASGTVGPNLDESKPSAEAVAAMVRSGGGGMPSFGGQLEPAQIDAVAAYVAAAAG